MPPITPAFIKTQFDQAKRRRVNWETHWQEVADLVLPTRDFIIRREPGEKRRDHIFSGVATQAAESLAAALHGLLTNPATPWFALVPEDYDLLVDDEIQEYLYDSSRRMLTYLSSTPSGFAVTIHEAYLDLVAFGTGVTQVMPDFRGLLRFTARALASFYFLEDEDSNVLHVFRRFEETAENLKHMFSRPSDILSDRVLENAKSDRGRHLKHPIIHVVLRRRDRDPTKVNGRNMPWTSIYMEEKRTGQDQPFIREGGFKVNPYLISRWSKAPEEVYGRSPAMTVLPDIKVINQMTYTVLTAAELAVHPPLNVVASGLDGPARTAPGSINWLRSMSQAPAPLITGVNPRIGQEMIDAQRVSIEKAFFLDALKLPELDRMTAEEVITRRQQGLLTASPVLSRLQAELLRPVVVRTFEWMKRTKRLLPAPEGLRGRGLKVDFQSPMAQSQKAGETGAILTALQSAIPLINVNPGIMQNVDEDKTMRAIWENSNADPRLLRTQEDVDAARAAQAQQEQMAQQVAIAGGAAAAAKDAAAAGRDVRGG